MAAFAGPRKRVVVSFARLPIRRLPKGAGLAVDEGVSLVGASRGARERSGACRATCAPDSPACRYFSSMRGWGFLGDLKNGTQDAAFCPPALRPPLADVSQA